MQDGRFAVRHVRLHQIGAREVFVCREHALGALALDAHEARKPCARAKEDRLETIFVFEFIDGEDAPDDGVRLDLDAERLEPVHFLLHDRLGQTELRDAIHKHAARNVQRLEHRYVIPKLGKIARAGKPRRSRADDGDLVPVGLRPGGSRRRMAHVPVGDKTLQPADADGLALDATRALALALRLLRAHSAADGGQRRSTRDNFVRLLKFPLRHKGNESRDIHCDGAARNAGFVFAIQAALCFVHSGRLVIAERDLHKVLIADKRLLRRHGMLLGIHIELGHIRTPPF